MSMMVFKTNNPQDSGIVEFDKNNILLNIYEKKFQTPQVI